MSAYSTLPKDRLAGLVQNWRADIVSGFIVFLIAVPLCLGISLASGVPPLAGIIAAVVGGLLVSQISGSYVTINGPAAGLIVVILGVVESLGGGIAAAGYPHMLAAVVVSGVLLFILSLLKAGNLSVFFPRSAIHGMLAAIGIIIISKQIHVALGVKPEAKVPLSLLLEVPRSLLLLNPEIAIIGVASLLVMVGFSFIQNKRLKMVPAPMVAVLVGVVLGVVFDLEDEHKYLFLGDASYSVGPGFLVTLPENVIASVLDGFPFPRWDKAFTYPFFIAVASITLVQGIETLLSATAVDRLDPYKRHSNLNRDMGAVGLGSAVSGMLGGLPMIAEIVRSSASISNGARTRWANFFHGLFMLVMVVAAGSIIHKIPLAALAGVLIFTGYRLAAPKVFMGMYKIGRDQIIIFVGTIVVTLATDLLIGVGAGILIKFMLHLLRGADWKTLFKPNMVVVNTEDEDTVYVEIKDAAIFSNYLGVKKNLDRLPRGKYVILDFSETTMVDYTTLEHIYHYAATYQDLGGKIEIVGLDHLEPESNYPLATRRMRKDGTTNNVETLNERQIELSVLAKELHAQFDPNRYVHLMAKQFNIGAGRKAKYGENQMIGELNGMRYKIKDLTVQEGARFTLQEFQMTVWLAEQCPFAIPAFTCGAEGLLTRVAVGHKLKGIGFEQYPQFARHYYLRGPDEAAICTFFTDEVVRYMETNTGYHVHGNGKGLLIYRNTQLLNADEIRALHRFAVGLLEAVVARARITV